NLAWRRFVTDQTLDFMLAELEPLRRITPDIPATTNMMYLFSQLNYQKIAPHLDVISWDDYPKWHNDQETVLDTAQRDAFNHDWFRSMRNGQPFLLMECTPSNVNWMPVNKLKRPGMLELGAMNAIAHGSDSIQYFQFRKSRGASEKLHGAVVDHAGHENTRVFRETAALGDRLSRMDGVCGTSSQARVALIFDIENGWAIDDLYGANNRRMYPETCIAHHKPFYTRGVSVDVIDSTMPFNAYALIIAPMLYMIRPGVARRLKDFARAGGTVVLTYMSGYVDEDDLCHLGGFPGDGLMELAGIWAEELDPLYPTDKNAIAFGENTQALSGKYEAHTLCEVVHPLDGCETLARYVSDYYMGMAAVTRNPYGDGQCFFIAARTEEKFLADFYGTLIESLSIPTATNASLPDGLHAAIREGDGEQYLFLLNCTGEEKRIPARILGEYPQWCDNSERALPRDLMLKAYGAEVFKRKV
ncbi:MAG: beta-galactosidase trimerization domain-containing protein, partial [Clostridia bacterium]|nr:beta-galactosidase trimerization domain-containing protein [Clostridia bacterium]